MCCYVPAAVGLALCLGIGTASAARYEIITVSITDLGTLGGAWLWDGSRASSRDLGLLPTGRLSTRLLPP